MKTKSRTVKAAYLAMGRASSTVVAIGIAAVLSRVFDKSDYATYRQALLAYTFVAPLLILGLPTAINYFMPAEMGRARGVLLENLILLGVSGALLSIFLAAGGNVLVAKYFDNPDLEKTLLVLALYPALLLPASATASCLIVQDKVEWVPLYTITTRLLTFVLVMIATWIFVTPIAAIGATVVAAVVTLILSLILVFKATIGSESAISIAGMRRQLAYSIPLGIGGIIATININLDKALVGAFTSSENFADFVNGATQVPFVGIITGSVTAILLPEIRTLLMDGKKARALELWKRAGLKCGVLLIPLMGFLLVTAPDIMAILYSEKYRSSAWVFRYYLLLLPVRIVIFGAIFQAAGKPGLVLKRALLTLVANLALSWTLAMTLGYEYIVVATIIVIYVVTIPYCFYSIIQILETSAAQVFPWIALLKLGGIAAAGGIPAYAVSIILADMNILVRLAVAGVVYAVPVIVGLRVARFAKLHLGRGVPLRKRLEWLT